MIKSNNIEFIHFDTIDSTNTWAKTHTDKLDQSCITCITADEQTHGRGRWKRSWLSPKNQNIYATIYFCIPKGATYLGNIPQILALSCVSILEAQGIEAKVKWPNDVLAKEKKIAGILCEAVTLKESTAVVLGIGLNVNMQEKLLSSIDKPATSLAQLSGKTWNIEQVRDLLLKEFLQDLEKLQKEGFSPFREFYENHLAFLGESISYFDGVKTIQGVCHSITSDGHLNLILQSGEMKECSTGEIQFS